ncbi:peptidase m24 : Xaa-Pro aminopeptidase OS=Singulisphaera acidiphila (strain ATCC BAA-1392 / DSM 18658 / VKM B-2454 / MOB10) GN=Sinac_3769 PE=3 SV=1: Creatinase_N: Peptidase_M24 [Gemmataceae bacterium]|nr:peptidase m24 : Xaa-Pro aminopeptidase OS=Singulisphaera acidiphila (strain ATCC BAA-1392 / DSM 18658 / VKM B-2454 / MOB10) GN=Sinac_3769 PE=3 SV=1: Creatinase_N: Peptidase_M24 [Gemmataceae bacterium]VTU01721.1 peptidase m24 : Xaa-Pro aminopeptidase OS=Singulisphaera acidiphila (strain ATCC BAA-1392 / DSM 18658 / VKM B-2454 / MOB10) GN=Sinac_3769 PE=3 SV=1: Creatinase_N: Peptidase_M24 [Gemmataceae bacterium]
MNYLLQRRQALVQNLKKTAAEAFLVTNPVNVTYLTNFTGDSSFYFGGAKNSIVISDTRFEEQIKEECAGLDAHIRNHNKTTYEAAAEVLNKAGVKSVAVEEDGLTLGELEQLKALAPKVTFVPVGGAVERQRTVKDPAEIDRIRDAVRVAERAFRMFIATVRESDSEKEMVDSLEAYIRRAGAKGSSFPPIVAVGERGALPHAPPTAKVLGDGTKLLIDWGADMLYKSDMTRTLKSPFGTSPTRRNKFERVGIKFDEVYDIVLQAQNAALAAIRPGVKAKDVDAAARKVFASSKLKDATDLKLADHFTHGLGHGIGLEVHEAPRVRANSEDVLEAGMVITIEPGIYIPGWGGVRIEDDVLVTPGGPSLLTNLSRESSSLEG